jgi:hypothetical protein
VTDCLNLKTTAALKKLQEGKPIMTYRDDEKLLANACLLGGLALAISAYIIGVVFAAFNPAAYETFKAVAVCMLVVGAVCLVGGYVFRLVLTYDTVSTDQQTRVRSSLSEAGYELHEFDALEYDKERSYYFYLGCNELELLLTAAEAEAGNWRIYQQLNNGENLMISPETLSWIRSNIGNFSDKVITNLRKKAADEVERKPIGPLWFTSSD